MLPGRFSNDRARSVAAAVIALALAAGAAPLARGQDATPTPPARPPERPAYVHPGTCAEPVGEPAYQIDPATAPLDQTDPFADPAEVRGRPGAVPVAVASATLDATFDDLFDPAQPHVLLVHESPETFGTPVACGDLVGYEDDGRIVIGLRPVGGSGFYGVAVFDEDEAGFLGLGGNEVRVTVYLSTVAAPAAAGAERPEPAGQVATEYAHPDWLVEPAWLQEQLDEIETLEDRDFILVGVWALDGGSRGVIPGTTQLDWRLFALSQTTDEAIEAWRAQVEDRLLTLNFQYSEDGLSPDDTIVLYDDGSLEATGVWWLLDYLGHEDKYLLQGGADAWIEYTGVDAPLPGVQSAPPAPADRDYAGERNDAVLATLTEVQASLEDPNVVLVDTRSPSDYAAGHIPGAVNVPAEENLQAEDPRYWREAAQLGELYGAAGVTPDRRVVVYGDTGVDAYVAYFTLRLLGYEDVAVYPAGWVEWSQYPDLPRDSATSSAG